MTEIIFERKIAEEVLVEKVATILRNGGIAVLPTDTIPGIGCRADDHDAVGRLFKLKERPENLPIPVILASKKDIENYVVKVPEAYYRLSERYWPGALTICLRSNGMIDRMVGGGLDTLGFRIPDYPFVRKIVSELGVPLALTSANPHNVQPSALHQRLLAWWKNEVEIIILGRSTAPRPASTVVDLTCDPHVILREGLLDIEELSSLMLGTGNA